MKLKAFLLAAVLTVMAWSAIHPAKTGVWFMEAAPVLIALPLLIATHRKFPLTPLVYILIAVHCIILLVGAHYTYARVPAGFMVSEWLGWERNHYDRLGHIAQGFIPAMIARELLLRTSTLQAGKWMFVLITLGCTGIAAVYEIIEWIAAVLTADGATDFLGTQGDMWDTQKDMLLALIGAAASLLLLSRLHDRQLKAL